MMCLLVKLYSTTCSLAQGIKSEIDEGPGACGQFAGNRVETFAELHCKRAIEHIQTEGNPDV